MILFSQRLWSNPANPIEEEEKPPVPRYNYQGAKDAGVSEEEIFNSLKSKFNDYDFDRAREAGVSLEEINKTVANKPKKGVRRSTKGMSKEEKAIYNQELLESGQHYSPLTTDTPSTREFGKGAAKGLTLGASEYVPGLEVGENPSGLAKTGEVVGSLVPLEGFLSLGAKYVAKPLINLALKSPVAQKALSSLASIVGVGVSGATYHAAEDLVQGKLPSVEDIAKNGIIWSAIDASLRGTGKLASFTKSLLTKAEQTGKSTVSLVDDIGQQMLKEGIDLGDQAKVSARATEILNEIKSPGKPFKVTPIEKAPPPPPKFEIVSPGESADLAAKKITPKQFTSIDNKVSELAEKSRPTEFNAEKLEKDVVESSLEKEMESYSPRAKDELELGENIQKDVKKQFKAEEAKYNALYDQSRKFTQETLIQPLTLSRKAFELIEDLQKFKTKPENYSKVQNTAETALKDAGFIIEKDASGKIISATAGPDGILLSDAIELKKRLYQIADYDVVEKSIKDKIKDLGRAVRNDVHIGFSGNKEAEKTFLEAEKAYGETAEKFGTDALYKIRGEKAPEKIAKLIDSPTAIKELRQTLSEAQMKQVEREILQRLHEQSYKKAANEFNQIKRQLSPESQRIGQSIVDSKAPLGSTAQRRAAKEGIVKNLSESIATGERPNQVLDLWKTKNGQKLVREATNGLPNQKQILDYLENQSLADFAEAVIAPSGKINFKKFNDMLKDPAVLENLRLTGGDDAVKLYKDLENLTDQININKSLFDKLPKNTPSNAANSEYGEYILEKSAQKPKEKPKVSQLFEKEQKLTQERVKESGKKEAETPAFGKEKIKRTKEKNEKRIKEIEKNKHPIFTKIDDFIAKLGSETKIVLGMLGLYSGPVKLIVAGGGYYLFKAMAKSQKFRNAIRQAASSKSNPKALMASLAAIDSSLD